MNQGARPLELEYGPQEESQDWRWQNLLFYSVLVNISIYTYIIVACGMGRDQWPHFIEGDNEDKNSPGSNWFVSRMICVFKVVLKAALMDM